jgi:hypothetical protein
MSMLDGLEAGICCVHRTRDWALIAKVEKRASVWLVIVPLASECHASNGLTGREWHGAFL